MTNTNIEWTDATWNPVRGCTVVSEGCRNCYAMKQAHRFSGPGQPYEGLTEIGNHGPRWNGNIRLVPEVLDAPTRWKKPRRIFVNSMSDLFHEDVPDEFIDQVFAVMALTPQHSYQILTKRPERMLQYCSDPDRPCKVAKANRAGEFTRSIADDYELSETQIRNIVDRRQWATDATLQWPLPNCWTGVSIEDQATADKRIPILLQTPAAVRWVSAEPLLGSVDLTDLSVRTGGGMEQWNALDRREAMDAEPGSPNTVLDWVVLGGESGPQARSCNVHWIRSLLRQCRTANVSCFVKQVGSRPWSGLGTHPIYITDRKGGDPSEWPEDLRVREYPSTTKGVAS